MIENHIPFISMSQQVYLPFWGCSFFEQFKAETTIAVKMAPGTQLVFLYLYYGRSTEPVNLTQMAKELSLSKATCTRAVKDLTSLLLSMDNEPNERIQMCLDEIREKYELPVKEEE